MIVGNVFASGANADCAQLRRAPAAIAHHGRRAWPPGQLWANGGNRTGAAAGTGRGRQPRRRSPRPARSRSTRSRRTAATASATESRAAQGGEIDLTGDGVFTSELRTTPGSSTGNSPGGSAGPIHVTGKSFVTILGGGVFANGANASGGATNPPNSGGAGGVVTHPRDRRRARRSRARSARAAVTAATRRPASRPAPGGAGRSRRSRRHADRSDRGHLDRRRRRRLVEQHRSHGQRRRRRLGARLVGDDTSSAGSARSRPPAAPARLRASTAHSCRTPARPGSRSTRPGCSASRRRARRRRASTSCARSAGAPATVVLTTTSTSSLALPADDLCQPVTYQVRCVPERGRLDLAATAPVAWTRQPSATQRCTDAPSLLHSTKVVLKQTNLKKKKGAMSFVVKTNGIGNVAATATYEGRQEAPRDRARSRSPRPAR